MIESQQFGTMPDGQSVEQYRLTNGNNVSVNILTLGGIIQSWMIPTTPVIDIVLGFDTVEEYLADSSYIGTVVGRYANRIANGTFSLEEDRYALSTNLLGNTLHGGEDGFHHRIWQAKVLNELDNPCLELTIHSHDGDQGFPGNLQVKVVYCLTEENSLRITYLGDSDKDTVFNPTQHSYFNLAGHDSGSAVGHLLQVNASHYTPADEDSIPTGELKSVAGTHFDFRQPRIIANVLAQNDPEILATNGLDHNWCLDDYADDHSNNRLAATAEATSSGVKLRVFSTMPGIQVYTANFLDSGLKGKKGIHYGPNHAICLETQFYPDTPNQPEFPTATLKRNNAFCSITEYALEY